MSVIVGLVGVDGAVTLGADSFVGSMWSRGITADPKLYRLGELLIGNSGAVSVSNAIRYRCTLPDRKENESDEHYIAVSVLDALRSAINSAGQLEQEKNVDSTDARLLIGYRGKLYDIGGDFGVCRIQRPYHAIGAGADYALGALRATQDVTAGLEAAVEHSPWCAPPFVILTEEKRVQTFESHGRGRAISTTKSVETAPKSAVRNRRME